MDNKNNSDWKKEWKDSGLDPDKPEDFKKIQDILAKKMEANILGGLKNSAALSITKIINELHGIDKQKPLVEGVNYQSATAEQSEAPALSQEFIDSMRQRSLDLLSKSKGVKEVTNTPIMSSVFKPNPARQQAQSTQSLGSQNNVKSDVQSDSDQEEMSSKKTKQKKDKTDKKDPLFSSVGSGKLQPVKAGDTLADVGGKLFNFMKVEYDWEKKKAKRDKKYRKKIDKIKDKQMDELIAAITGKKTSMLGKFGRTLRKSGLLKYGLIAAGGVGAFMVSKNALANIDWKKLFEDKFSFGEKTSQTEGSLDVLKSKQIYEYLTKEKGLSHEHAMGMLTNIQAESSFKPGAIGDEGTSGGLFQHHNQRFDEMKKFAGPDWQKNWKGQVDFALQEKEGKDYTNRKFNSAEEASKHFTEKFEKPKNPEVQSEKRIKNIPEIEKSLTEKSSAVPITSGYGHRHGATHTGMHEGVDIAGKTGDAVVSTNAGTVSMVSSEKNYGNFVEVDHGNGLKTRYAHLSKTNVEVGDVLTKGQKLGEVGSTGRSSGPHLHYEVWKDGKRIDPTNTLSFSPVSSDYELSAADKTLKETSQLKKSSSNQKALGLISNKTNVINGSTTYNVSQVNPMVNSVLFDKQYLNLA